MLFLAQLEHASPTAIKDWLIIVGGVMGLVLLGKQLFMRSPSIEAEFVTRAQHAADLDLVKKDVDSLRGKIDRDFEKLGTKLDTMRDELNVQGSRRSKTLFEHIKELTDGINGRVNNHDEKIARLDERTKEKNK